MDSSGHPAGLALAIRSTAAGGRCTAVGIFYEELTPMPLLEMYTIGATFHTGRAAVRAVMPQIMELITAGRFDPAVVTTATATWSDAAEAVAEAPIKSIVSRES